MGKEIPDPPIVLRKVFSKQFALSDVEVNTTGPLNRGVMVDFSLLRTLLGIHQISLKPNFYVVIESFLLLEYTSLAASRTHLQQLLACLNFALDLDLFSWYKRKKRFL